MWKHLKKANGRRGCRQILYSVFQRLAMFCQVSEERGTWCFGWPRQMLVGRSGRH
jgi:hypothetical protein